MVNVCLLIKKCFAQRRDLRFEVISKYSIYIERYQKINLLIKIYSESAPHDRSSSTLQLSC